MKNLPITLHGNSIEERRFYRAVLAVLTWIALLTACLLAFRGGVS